MVVSHLGAAGQHDSDLQAAVAEWDGAIAIGDGVVAIAATGAAQSEKSTSFLNDLSCRCVGMAGSMMAV